MGKMSTVPATETDQLRDQLREKLEPIVVDHGVLLVDIELAGSRTQPILRLFVHKEPGISLDLCQSISREVADYLDVDDPIPGRYRLEVTSPGLDRPLTTDGDFARAMGRMLKIVMASGKNHRGRLVDWNENLLRIDGPKGTSEEVVRTEIAKATIEVEFKK
jgi:ribosome maturation factor RimP